MTYYDLLAEGFRSGHLYVPARPSPQLLLKADPYDSANQSLWLSDGSLYKGRYYLYWGPVPAIILALIKGAFNIRHAVGDPILSFAAFSCAAICGALIIDRTGRRLFGYTPRWLRGCAIIAFGFANPVPHLLASSGVYMACIGAGQAFALAGLLFAFDAVWSAPARRFDWRLTVAGTLWALAVGSRLSLAPVMAMLAVLTAIASAWPVRARLKTLVENGFLLLAPIVAGVFLLLLYNHLRFDDWFEAGIKYQTTTLKFQLSPSYLGANLYSYTLRPFFSSCRFPFIVAPAAPGPRAFFPQEMQLPTGYLQIEPVVGWLRAVPLTWLLPVIPFAVVQRLGMILPRDLSTAKDATLVDAKPRTFIWLVTSLSALAVISGIPAMGLYMATMRYMADFSNGLILLAILGGFALYSWASHRWAAGLLFCAPAAASVAIGLLLGYQGYIGHFKTYNPELDATLVKALSVCGTNDPGAAPTK